MRHAHHRLAPVAADDAELRQATRQQPLQPAAAHHRGNTQLEVAATAPLCLNDHDRPDATHK